MIHHFNCPAHLPDMYEPLVFSWDDENGEVSGRDADTVLACFRGGVIDAHPYPWSWELTSTKNRTDIAAVIGNFYHLPPELKHDYPVCEADLDLPDGCRLSDDGNSILDANGNFVSDIVY